MDYPRVVPNHSGAATIYWSDTSNDWSSAIYDRYSRTWMLWLDTNGQEISVQFRPGLDLEDAVRTLADWRKGVPR